MEGVCIGRATTVGRWGSFRRSRGLPCSAHSTPRLSRLSLGREPRYQSPAPAVAVWGLFLMGVSYLAHQQARFGAQAARGSSRRSGELPEAEMEGSEASAASLLLDHSPSSLTAVACLPLSPRDHSVRQAGNTSVCQGLCSQGPAQYLAQKHIWRIQSVSYMG